MNYYSRNFPSPDIPFWERKENIIKWKVCDGNEFFVHTARIYDGDVFVKVFFGLTAVEIAEDFIEEYSIYWPIKRFNFNIRQEISILDFNIHQEISRLFPRPLQSPECEDECGEDNKWYEFSTRGEAEIFAKTQRYKLPIYKSF